MKIPKCDPVTGKSERERNMFNSRDEFEAWVETILQKGKMTDLEKHQYMSYLNTVKLTEYMEKNKVTTVAPDDVARYCTVWVNEAEAKMVHGWSGIRQTYFRPPCTGRVYSHYYYYPRIQERQLSSMISWVPIYEGMGEFAKARQQEHKVALWMDANGMYGIG